MYTTYIYINIYIYIYIYIYTALNLAEEVDKRRKDLDETRAGTAGKKGPSGLIDYRGNNAEHPGTYIFERTRVRTYSYSVDVRTLNSFVRMLYFKYLHSTPTKYTHYLCILLLNISYIQFFVSMVRKLLSWMMRFRSLQRLGKC
jgi:hypothetical protein